MLKQERHQTLGDYWVSLTHSRELKPLLVVMGLSMKVSLGVPLETVVLPVPPLVPPPVPPVLLLSPLPLLSVNLPEPFVKPVVLPPLLLLLTVPVVLLLPVPLLLPPLPMELLLPTVVVLIPLLLLLLPITELPGSPPAILGMVVVSMGAAIVAELLVVPPSRGPEVLVVTVPLPMTVVDPMLLPLLMVAPTALGIPPIVPVGIRVLLLAPGKLLLLLPAGKLLLLLPSKLPTLLLLLPAAIVAAVVVGVGADGGTTPVCMLPLVAPTPVGVVLPLLTKTIVSLVPSGRLTTSTLPSPPVAGAAVTLVPGRVVLTKVPELCVPVMAGVEGEVGLLVAAAMAKDGLESAAVVVWGIPGILVPGDTSAWVPGPEVRDIEAGRGVGWLIKMAGLPLCGVISWTPC